MSGRYFSYAAASVFCALSLSVLATEAVAADPQGADLSLTMAGPQSIVRGETATYVLVVKNVGKKTASGLTVRNALPAGTTFAAKKSSSACKLSGDAVLCTASSVKREKSTSLTIVLKSLPTVPCTMGTMRNQATATSETFDLNTTNNQAEVATSVTCPAPAAACSDGIDNDGDGLIDFPADPGCTDAQDNDEFHSTFIDVSIKKVGSASAALGSVISYALTVKNAGPGAATDLLVQDFSATSLLFTAAGSDPSCSLNGTTVTCSKFSLAPGQKKTLTLVYMMLPAVTCDSTISNYATIGNMFQQDSNPSNNWSGMVSTNVTCTPSVQN